MKRLLVIVFFVACSKQPAYSLIGDAQRGQSKYAQYGCPSCHTRGAVGPPLDHMASRLYIAGEFPNVPQHMVRWISHPQAMKPHDAMPDLNVSERDARDIAAYLYTLK